MTRVEPSGVASLHAHAAVIPIGAALLIGALVTDVLYIETLNVQWETFSIWLLTAGLIVAAVAALVLLAEVLLGRVQRMSWLRFAAVAAAALVSLANAFVHSRDAYTAVVPSGVTLSAVAAVLLIAVGLRGWDLASSMEARS